MKGKLILAPNDEMELFDYNLNFGMHPFDYEISINTDLSDSFVSLISNTGDLEESIETSLEMTDDQGCIDLYNKCKSNLPELLQNAEYVVFGFEMQEIADAGAKVLHNRCVEIGEKFKIPIITKSSFNQKPGTIISEIIEEDTIKSIIKKEVSRISIVGNGIIRNIPAIKEVLDFIKDNKLNMLNFEV